MFSPFSCSGFLAWGLSALCTLFPPGEPELLPAPFPSSPTRIPLRITSPLSRSFNSPTRYSCTQRTDIPMARYSVTIIEDEEKYKHKLFEKFVFVVADQQQIFSPTLLKYPKVVVRRRPVAEYHTNLLYTRPFVTSTEPDEFCLPIMKEGNEAVVKSFQTPSAGTCQPWGHGS